MKLRNALPALLLVAASCASEGELRSGLTSEPTTAQWGSSSALLFRVLDSEERSIGRFTLQMTDERANACFSGEWRRARPLSSDLTVVNLADWWRDEARWPSYQITGRLLTVELNGGAICDAYVTVQAELDDTGAHGYLEAGGVTGSVRYGTVAVERFVAIADERTEPMKLCLGAAAPMNVSQELLDVALTNAAAWSNDKYGPDCDVCAESLVDDDSAFALHVTGPARADGTYSLNTSATLGFSRTDGSIRDYSIHHSCHGRILQR